MLSQAAVFTRRVRDHMAPAAVRASADVSCAELVARLRAADATAAIIVDEQGAPAGIVTEQDISRRVTFAVGAETPVCQVMTTPVETIRGDEYLHHAVAQMRRRAIRHLPVVNNGELSGMLQLDGVLATISDRSVAQIELVDHSAVDPSSLQAAKSNQCKVASQLLEDEMPAPDIQNLLTRLNDELYRSVITHCVDRMRADWGLAPVPFDVIVMGSGGRGENYLTPDQDNGIIIADYPDQDHSTIDGWFIELSQRMTETLDRVGFPLCHGNVMATNPLWRKTISQWRSQVSGWIAQGEGNFLRLCDIFFDFASVYGEGTLSRQLRNHVTANAQRPFFLREMFKVDEQHDVALGPFGWLQTDRQRGPDRGKLNLKITGTLPLIGAVRILALWRGVAATSTMQRIAELHQGGALGSDERDNLIGAYRHITQLLLRQQLRDAQAGLAPGNHVSPKNLSKREKQLLVMAFKAIRAFRAKLRTELTGEVY